MTKRRKTPLEAIARFALIALCQLLLISGCQPETITTEPEKPLDTAPLIIDPIPVCSTLGKPIEPGRFGPDSCAREGDFLLQNSVSGFVVTPLGRETGLFARGCNIVDATPAGEQADMLRAAVFCFDGSVHQQPDWKEMKIVASGTKRRGAAVRASGTYGKDIHVQLVYRLLPEDRALQMELEISNMGAQQVSLSPGLAVYTGRTLRFAPPVGFDLAFRKALIYWLGWSAGKTSYGIFDEKAALWSSYHEPGLSIIHTGRKRIAPAQTIKLRWYFYTVKAGLSELCGIYWKIRRLPAGNVLLKFVEGNEPPRPVSGVKVSFRDGRGAIGAACVSGADGIASCMVPAQELLIECLAPGRRTVPKFLLTPTLGEAKSSAFRLIKPSSAKCKVYRVSLDGNRKPGPARILVQSADRRTPQPDFGPEWCPEGAGPLIIAPKGKAAFPLSPALVGPGRYLITACADPTFSAHSRLVEIGEETDVDITFELKKRFSTDPYIPLDCGQKTTFSLDGLLPLEQRNMLNRIEGLAGTVFVLEPPFDAAAFNALARKEIAKTTVAGADYWAPGIGRFRCWPVSSPEKAVRLQKTVQQTETLTDLRNIVKSILGKDTVLVAASPRDRKQSYFYISGYRTSNGPLPPKDAVFPFDVMELYQGRDSVAVNRNMKYWFRLLNAGYRVMIVGSSNARGLVWDPPGYPRTYVSLGSKSDAVKDIKGLIRQMVKTGDAFVSTGPFLRVAANGKAGFGSVVKAQDGRVELDVKVMAPEWISLSNLNVYVNGTSKVSIELDPADRNSVRLDRKISLKLSQDSWLVVAVRGKRGMRQTHVGSGLRALIPVAVGNPVWFDVNGDNVFTAPDF